MRPRPPLGSGQRFAALEGKLAKRPGVYNPAGLAAAIGRKKYGSASFNKLALAAKGRSAVVNQLRSK